MIEDDLRALVAAALTGVDTYARQIPPTLPECVLIQAHGGTPSTSTIRRATHQVTVAAVSSTRQASDLLLRSARDAVITSLPCDLGGTHYYHARALAEGRIDAVRPKGDTAYISHVTMEVLASL